MWADSLISLGVVAVVGLVVVSRLRPGLLAHVGQKGRVGPRDTLTAVSHQVPSATDAAEMGQSVSSAPPVNSASIFEAIKSLAELRDSGLLTDAEFEAKKADLLARL